MLFKDVSTCNCDVYANQLCHLRRLHVYAVSELVQVLHRQNCPVDKILASPTLLSVAAARSSFSNKHRATLIARDSDYTVVVEQYYRLAVATGKKLLFEFVFELPRLTLT